MLYQRYGKRTLDVAAAGLGLILTSPILLVVGAGVWLTTGRPILFPQERAGRHGKAFRAWKIRTMRSMPDGASDALSEHERITAVGRWLRRTSIDELPQLWNVMRGDMSLVGPRPLLLRYRDYYEPQELERFSLRPGITGWAQVNGRNDLAWDARLRHDVWYVRHCSLGLDLRILGLTLRHLVTGEGFSADPRSTLRDLDQVRGRQA
jgi:lipopolysaccharide/colanic/teichoic acid biosynthesis glycosyltransferase